ncbi:MAG: hypothetical protein LBF59_06295 [Prevotellaceae bacterium]|jgi:fructokinase|nr:hypothetical protein [Prevotellaceae bacterium]
MGGWKNYKNQQYYFDSSKVFDNPEDAIQWGIENRQIAIFDLTSKKVIEL